MKVPKKVPKTAPKIPQKTRKSGQNGMLVFLLALSILIVALLLLNKPQITTRSTWNTWNKLPGGIIRFNQKAKKLTTEIPVWENAVVENWYFARRCLEIHFSLSVKAEQGKQKQLAQHLQKNEAQIQDRIRAIIGTASFEQIRDPQLHFVKRQVQQSLELTVGPQLVSKVLIPSWQAPLLH